MDRCRAAMPPALTSGGWHADDSDIGDDELDVFTADRYFNGALADDDALWCDRSSSLFSSVLKTWQREGSAPTPTAATSSSEASWNSRSALLPNRPVAAAAVEEEPANAGSEHTGRKTSSPSLLRRWLLGVAGCACACHDGEESVSASPCRSEADAGSGHGGKKRTGTGANAMLPRSTSKQAAVEEVAMVTVRPGKCVDDDDALLADSGELSMRRRESLGMFRPAGRGNTLMAAKQNSPFTIVAGSMPRGGAATTAGVGGGSPDRRDSGADDAASSEPECMYPPSEASVVWSVVTADGAASGNFSSAASGYYHFNGGDEEALRHMARGTTKSNRRSRADHSGLLMGCISRRAVDAVGPRGLSTAAGCPDEMRRR